MTARIKLGIIAIYFLTVLCESKDYGFVTWTDDIAVASVTQSSFEIPEVHVARATYSNEINETG